MGEEPDYKSLVRTRGGYRGMVTRYGDRVSDLCKGIRVGESMEEDLALRSMFEEFTKYVKKLDEVQDTIDQILAPEDMEAMLASSSTKVSSLCKSCTGAT